MMYQPGDLIIYGGEGVCRVAAISPAPIAAADPERIYYTLTPLYRQGVIYAPTDVTVPMRPILSREEALDLIRSIPTIAPDTANFTDTKQAAQQQVALALGQGAGSVTNPVQGTPGRTTGGGYNNGSLTSSQVQELQNALGVKADGMWGSESKAAAGGMTADQAWAAYQNQTNASNAGMNASYFNAFMQSMVAQMSAGKMQAAQANIQANWDKLSDSQKEQLIALTQKYS